MENLSIYKNHPELYDYIYGGDDQKTLQFMTWLCKYIGINPEDQKILDMGSGTGGLLVPLTKMDYNIVGMEPYDGMIEQAKVKADKSGVTLSQIQGGFETLETIEEYHLIFSINGSFAYLEDIDEYLGAFNRVKKALKPGGYFLVDLMNFYSIIKHYDHPEPIEFQINNNQVFAYVKHEIDHDKCKWVHQTNLFIENNHKWTQYVDYHHLSMINKSELRLYAKISGLQPVFFLNGYDDRLDERKNGSRLIGLFQK